MKQRSLAESGFERRPKATKGQRLLDEMDAVVPWSRLVAVIEPTYPKPAAGGRPPFPIEAMLRIHLMQQWFALAVGRARARTFLTGPLYLLSVRLVGLTLCGLALLFFRDGLLLLGVGATAS